jgi:hypothetical protein
MKMVVSPMLFALLILGGVVPAAERVFVKVDVLDDDTGAVVGFVSVLRPQERVIVVNLTVTDGVPNAEYWIYVSAFPVADQLAVSSGPSGLIQVRRSIEIPPGFSFTGLAQVGGIEQASSAQSFNTGVFDLPTPPRG